MQFTSLFRLWRGRSAVFLAGLLGATAVAVVSAAPATQSAGAGEATFQEKCAACHTIGGGKLVGPDLKGVTTRRTQEWLKSWISAPDQVLAAGDPVATQLFQEYGIPMPNLGLTDQQVESLIAYLQTTETPAAAQTLPSLYVPTLIASVVGLVILTALGLGMGRKQVEVRS